MRFISIILFVFIFAGNLLAFSIDTSNPIKIKYSKKELKKEIKDFKFLESQLKDWNKSIQKNNPDYLNEVFKNLLKVVEKEHNELSNRISERSKKLIPPASSNPSTNGTNSEDKPKVYNAELKEQMVRVSKDDILQKKAESDYLSKYIQLIRTEKNILFKLTSIKEFDSETKSDVYTSISKEIIAFKAEMKAEIDLMKKETSKK